MLFVSMTAVMAQDYEEFVKVSTSQELKSAIQANNSAKIQLTSDIVDRDLRQICGTFKGVITGKHKVYDENLKDSVDAMYSIDGERGNGGKTTWLFDKVDGATFEYIYFKNFRVERDDSNLGLIANEASNSTFSNLTFDNISLFEEDDNAGVIAGKANNCKFEYVLTKYCDVTVDGQCVGGLVGESSKSNYMLCVLSLTSAAFADGTNPDALSGGFVGLSNNDNFLGCFNAGIVGADCNMIGGIVAKAYNSKFTVCNNGYAVLSCDDDDMSAFVDNTRKIVRNLTAQQKLNFNDKIVQYGTIVGINMANNSFLDAFILNSSTASQANMSNLSIYYYVKNFMANSSGLSNDDINLVNNAALAVSFLTYAMDYVVKYVSSVTYGQCSASPEDFHIGGICGYAKNCNFERCTNSAMLFNSQYCGGIVGNDTKGIINNCLHIGSMAWSNHKDGVGCIAGTIDGTKITNCFSTAETPIVGGDAIILPSSWIDANSGNNYRKKSNNTNGFSRGEMQFGEMETYLRVVANWLNNGAENRNLAVKPWRQNGAECGSYKDEFPVLYASHNVVTPYNLIYEEINSEEDLRAFAKKVNDGEPFCNAILMKDIEMTSNELWTPIGTKDCRWRGVFNGQGHTISGLKCSVEDNSEEGAGLFGTVDVHADIRNVILDASCEIEHKSSKHDNAYGAGGIVGNVRNDRRGWGNVLIRNCGNYGKVTTSHHAGGILGRVINDDNDGDGSYVQIVVDSCFNSGVITADGNSGLLCGYMQNYGVVTNSWSNGSLKQKGNDRVFDMGNPNGEAEYFVGYDTKLSISDCYDYQSVVDWCELAEAKQFQDGVSKDYALTIALTDKEAYTNTRELQVKEIKYTRTFNNTNYQALYIPFELDYEDWCDDFDIYDIIMFHEYDRNDDGLIDEYMLEAKKVMSGHTQANHPYIIKAKTKGEKTFIKNDAKLYAAKSDTIDCSTTKTKYYFIGTYEKIKNMKTAGYYGMSSGMLCPAHSDDAELGAYRWYLIKEQRAGSGSSNAPQIRVFVGGEDEGATGINTVIDSSCQNSDTYTISGQKVNSSNLPAGVYIKNGKKFLVK